MIFEFNIIKISNMGLTIGPTHLQFQQKMKIHHPHQISIVLSQETIE